MKTIVAFIISIGVTAVAFAAVSTNNIMLSTNPGFGSDYALTVYQDAQATNPTTILFNYTDSKLIFVTSNIDEGSDWYLVTAGSVFSTSTITAGEFPLFIKGDFSGFTTNQIDAPEGSIFLGVNTGLGFSESGPNRQFFGWVELQSDGGNLSYVKSAITYAAPGIVVGTTTVIPEPSATVLVFAGISLMAVSFMRRRT